MSTNAGKAGEAEGPEQISRPWGEDWRRQGRERGEGNRERRHLNI
jgi:hypothetical protein